MSKELVQRLANAIVNSLHDQDDKVLDMLTARQFDYLATCLVTAVKFDLYKNNSTGDLVFVMAYWHSAGDAAAIVYNLDTGKVDATKLTAIEKQDGWTKLVSKKAYTLKEGPDSMLSVLGPSNEVIGRGLVAHHLQPLVDLLNKMHDHEMNRS